MIREYNPETDKNFVMSAYLKGTRQQGMNPWRETQEFYEASRPAQEALLERSITLVEEDSGKLKGYVTGYYDYNQELLFKKPCFVVHFIYTQKKFRKQGISKALIDQLIKQVLSQTPSCLITTVALNQISINFAHKVGWKTLGTTLVRDFNE